MAQDITPEEYVSTLFMVRAAAVALSDLPIEKCILVATLATSICPVIDPSLWINKREALEVDVEFMRAAGVLATLGKKLAAMDEAEDQE